MPRVPVRIRDLVRARKQVPGPGSSRGHIHDQRRGVLQDTVSALSATLLQLAETLPTGQRQKLVEALGSSAAADHEASQRLSLVASAPEFAAQIAQLMTAWREEPTVNGRGLAIALETAGFAVDEGRSREVSVVWTGP